MDMQEIYDSVCLHLIKQGKPALGPVPMYINASNNTSICMYRTPDGCKCAFGHLIPDDLYDPKMENKQAVQVIEEWPKVGIALDIYFDLNQKPSDKLLLVTMLQRVHDHSTTGAGLKQRLIVLGERLNLNTDVVKDAVFPEIWRS